LYGVGAVREFVADGPLRAGVYAVLAGRAQAELELVARRGRGTLADQVDHAAHRAEAVQHRRRTAQYLDAVEVDQARLGRRARTNRTRVATTVVERDGLKAT